MKIEFINLKREKVLLPKGREVMKRESSYGICFKNQRIMLVHSAYNDWWELPGGKLERGELPQDAMRREFQEETGYKVPDQEFEFIGDHKEYFYDDYSDVFWDSKMHFFYFQSLEEEPSFAFDKLDVKDVSWFSKEQVASIGTHPVSRQFINHKLGWQIHK